MAAPSIAILCPMKCVHVKLISRPICQISHLRIIFLGILVFIKVLNMAGDLILLNIHIIGLKHEANRCLFMLDTRPYRFKAKSRLNLKPDCELQNHRSGRKSFQRAQCWISRASSETTGIISWKDKMLLLPPCGFSSSMFANQSRLIHLFPVSGFRNVFN